VVEHLPSLGKREKDRGEEIYRENGKEYSLQMSVNKHKIMIGSENHCFADSVNINRF
jgi:hypothetical protein